jgi:predicted transcriptional regulator
MNLSDYSQIIKRHQESAPVKVVPLARECGLEVYNNTALPNDISGMIRRDATMGGKAGYAVIVNGNHHAHRRRFTIAHEIAHFVLHRDLIGDGIQDDALYRSSLSGRVEAQANRFAAEILMPWDLLNPAITSGTNDVAELAQMFSVSKSAMSIRLGVPYETVLG